MGSQGYEMLRLCLHVSELSTVWESLILPSSHFRNITTSEAGPHSTLPPTVTTLATLAPWDAQSRRRTDITNQSRKKL